MWKLRSFSLLHNIYKYCSSYIIRCRLYWICWLLLLIMSLLYGVGTTVYIILLLLSHKYIYCLYTASACSQTLNLYLHARVCRREMCLYDICIFQYLLSVLNMRRVSDRRGCVLVIYIPICNGCIWILYVGSLYNHNIILACTAALTNKKHTNFNHNLYALYLYISDTIQARCRLCCFLQMWFLYLRISFELLFYITCSRNSFACVKECLMC